MSLAYDKYLMEHRRNVITGYEWIKEHLPKSIDEKTLSMCEWLIKSAHDESKNRGDEYTAYDDYFYGNNKSFAVVQEFNKAWLMHIHRNPHHWQHWVLINDDPENGEILIEMPDEYVIEMICDWWSFCWKSGNLGDIQNWYNEHKEYMKLHDATRKRVERIIESILDKIHELK